MSVFIIQPLSRINKAKGNELDSAILFFLHAEYTQTNQYLQDLCLTRSLTLRIPLYKNTARRFLRICETWRTFSTYLAFGYDVECVSSCSLANYVFPIVVVSLQY